MRTIRATIALLVLLFSGAPSLAFNNTYLGDDAEFHSLSSGIPSVGANTFISPRTTSWYADDSPAVNAIRFGDRLFVGDAATNFPATSTCGTGDWFSTFEGTTNNGNCGYTIGFNMIVESKTNNGNSSGAILGAGQGADCSGACGVFGVTGFALNNRSGTTAGAWGAYFECDQVLNTSSGCLNEFEVANFVSDAYAIFPDPFQLTTVGGAQIGCGSGISSPTTFKCGAGIYITANTQKFKTGWVIGNTALVSGAGPTGLTHAGSMPAGSSLVWYSSAGTIVGSITIDSSGNVLLAGNGSLKFNGTAITVP